MGEPNRRPIHERRKTLYRLRNEQPTPEPSPPPAAPPAQPAAPVFQMHPAPTLTRAATGERRFAVLMDLTNIEHIVGTIQRSTATPGQRRAKFPRVNYGQMVRLLMGPGRKDEFRICYTSAKPESMAHGYYTVLKAAHGFGVKSYLRDEPGEEKEVDVAMAVDIVRSANEGYDVLIVAGDRDYLPAINLAKGLGRHVEIAAFPAMRTKHDAVLSLLRPEEIHDIPLASVELDENVRADQAPSHDLPRLVELRRRVLEELYDKRVP
jgi:hypothetical protein